VARLQGHTGAALVLNRYGHAMPDELASAGDVLGQWLDARTTTRPTDGVTALQAQ
jgi:hypothetical protein